MPSRARYSGAAAMILDAEKQPSGIWFPISNSGTVLCARVSALRLGGGRAVHAGLGDEWEGMVVLPSCRLWVRVRACGPLRNKAFSVLAIARLRQRRVNHSNVRFCM